MEKIEILKRDGKGGLSGRGTGEDTISFDDFKKLLKPEEIKVYEDSILIVQENVKQETLKMKSDDIRMKRNELLNASDWTQMPDIPEATKSKWVYYRQKLRDITSQKTFPETVVWPTPPN